MRVYRDLNELPQFEGSVITIGSFDGVHGGHTKILDRIKQLSKELGMQNIVITFNPHPRSIIYPKDKSLKLLTSLQEKLDLFEANDIDNVVVVPFTVEFSQISAQEYIENFLVKLFKPKFIVIGYDHRFGLNRSGNLELLKQLKPKYDYDVIEITKHEIDEITISSTKIRTALIKGNLDKATTLLSHPYALSGSVIRGRKLGTEIGFPTANLLIEEKLKLIPHDGIYACHVIVRQQKYNGMLYIGDIPTIGTDNPKSIEVNIFDFNEDIYGERITVHILHYLRDDQKFDGIESLKVQLGKDRDQAQSFFLNYSKPEAATVAIAILNYNTRHFLESFLPSISFSATYNFNTYVIDNGSDDDSLTYVEEWHPEIKLIRFSKNHGFAGAYNKAISQIAEDYIVILNSDVEVTENWLDPLVEYMNDHPEVAAVMPKICALENKGSFEYAGACGGHLDYLGYPFCRGRIFDTVEKDNNQYDDIEPVFWATGAAMMIRKQVFQALGGFDEQYFAHQEEIDLCWRIQRSGYKIMVIPSSTVYHVGGGTLDYSNSKKVYLNFRNNLSTLFKNESLLNTLWKLPIRLILDGVAGIKFLLTGNPKSTWEILRAHLSFYFEIPRLLKKKSHYDNMIDRLKISNVKKLPLSNKSILWQYYILRRHKYSQIFK